MNIILCDSFFDWRWSRSIQSNITMKANRWLYLFFQYSVKILTANSEMHSTLMQSWFHVSAYLLHTPVQIINLVRTFGIQTWIWPRVWPPYFTEYQVRPTDTSKSLRLFCIWYGLIMLSETLWILSTVEKLILSSSAIHPIHWFLQHNMNFVNFF